MLTMKARNVLQVRGSLSFQLTGQKIGQLQTEDFKTWTISLHLIFMPAHVRYVEACLVLRSLSRASLVSLRN